MSVLLPIGRLLPTEQFLPFGRSQHRYSGSNPDTNRVELDEAPTHDRSLNIGAASPGKYHRGSDNTTSPCGETCQLAGGDARGKICDDKLQLCGLSRLRDNFWHGETWMQDKGLRTAVGVVALFISSINKSQGRTPNLLTFTRLGNV